MERNWRRTGGCEQCHGLHIDVNRWYGIQDVVLSRCPVLARIILASASLTFLICAGGSEDKTKWCKFKSVCWNGCKQVQQSQFHTLSLLVRERERERVSPLVEDTVVRCDVTGLCLGSGCTVTAMKSNTPNISNRRSYASFFRCFFTCYPCGSALHHAQDLAPVSSLDLPPWVPLQRARGERHRFRVSGIR